MTLGSVVVGTEVRNGFTFSADARSWAVLGGLSPGAVAGIKTASFRHATLDGDRLDELTDKDRVLEAVKRMLDAPIQADTLCATLGFFIARGVLLAPYGGIDRRLRFASFDPNLDDWLANVEQNARLQGLPPQARRTIANVWLCTGEGRSMTIDRDALCDFVRAHLRGKVGAKWVSGLNEGAVRGLKHLAAALNVEAANRKWSRFNQLQSDLRESEYKQWSRWYEQWINEKHLGSISAHKLAFGKLCEYLAEHAHLLPPTEFFSRHAQRTPILDWFKSSKGNSWSHLQRVIRSLHEFFEWIVTNNDEFTVRDEWTGEPILRPDFFIPIRQSDLDQIASARTATRERPAQTVQMALPLEYLSELERIILDDDMAWPKTRRVDWIEWQDPKSGMVHDVYCPVLPYLVLLLLKLPLRQVQARRLDSGEGDSERFNLETNAWEANQGPHAELWERLGVENPRRGILRRIDDTWTGETLCGFYINSNKASDRKTLFSEKSGYVISWHNVEAIEIVAKMRRWQERYNPVPGPTEYSQVRPGVFEKMAESAARRRPACFYLFRYPAGNSSEWHGSPPSGQQLRMFWYELLAVLERRLRSRMANAPELITTWQGPSPQASPYTLHGLRHAGLTRLAMAGVHPWILQNIVAGHAAYIMTLYYLKPNPAHISNHLNEKYVQAMRNRQEEFKQFLSSRTLEEAHRLSVANGPEALKEVQKFRAAGIKNCAALMSTLDHGICPNGRTRCDEGMLIHNRTEKKHRELRNAYGPVPLTVGGAPDCTQCRFYVTGTPFVDGLRVKTNEVSFATCKCAQRHRGILQEIDRLEEQRTVLDRKGEMLSVPDDQKLQLLKQELKSEAETLANLAESLNSHGEMFQKVRGLLREQKKSGDTSVPALLFDDEPKFEWGLVPKFEAIDELCHAAKWYPSIKAEDLCRERREKIVQMLVRQGKPPVLAMMSEEEAEAAAGAMTAFLYMRLGKTATRRLFDGQETFESLGITADVETVMARAIDKPVALSIWRPQPIPGIEPEPSGAVLKAAEGY